MAKLASDSGVEISSIAVSPGYPKKSGCDTKSPVHPYPTGIPINLFDKVKNVTASSLNFNLCKAKVRMKCSAGSSSERRKCFVVLNNIFHDDLFLGGGVVSCN
jgi:hypothetical protein